MQLKFEIAKKILLVEKSKQTISVSMSGFVSKFMSVELASLWFIKIYVFFWNNKTVSSKVTTLQENIDVLENSCSIVHSLGKSVMFSIF